MNAARPPARLILGAIAGVLVGSAAAVAFVAVTRPEPAPVSHHESPRSAPSRGATASPSVRPTSTATVEPSASANASPDAVPSCFADAPPDAEASADVLVADELLARLPSFANGQPTERHAWVGSATGNELADYFVAGLQACTGKDPGSIRIGLVGAADTFGVWLVAAEVDGFSGHELARLIVADLEDKEIPLEPGTYDGWSYLSDGDTFGITQSATTVYWLSWMCCVETAPGDERPPPTVHEMLVAYLDGINDQPAD